MFTTVFGWFRRVKTTTDLLRLPPPRDFTRNPPTTQEIVEELQSMNDNRSALRIIAISKAIHCIKEREIQHVWV